MKKAQSAASPAKSETSSSKRLRPADSPGTTSPAGKDIADILESIDKRLSSFDARLSLVEILHREFKCLRESLEFSQQQGASPRPYSGCGQETTSYRGQIGHFKQKEHVKSRGRELKGTDFSVNDQFPKEILEQRRVLFPIRRGFIQKGSRAVIAVDRLYVDGQLHRDPDTTPWLY
ncbi:hypothetical protein ACER0C_019931 [Sarotherodon galilaeus]